MARKKWIVVVVGAVLGAPGLGWCAMPDLGLGTLGMKDVSFEVTGDVFGKYIWRGQTASNGTVFQPGVTASSGNLTAGVWANLDLANPNGERDEFTEVDLYLDYSDDLPVGQGFGFSTGVIQYEFNPGSGRTTELYAGIQHNCAINPSATLYWDVDAAGGFYASLGLGHTIDNVLELIEGSPVSVELSGSLGWGDTAFNSNYWPGVAGFSTADAGFSDLAFSVALPFEYAGVSISPSLSIVQLLDSDIKNIANNQKSFNDTSLFAGVSLKKSLN